MLSVKPGTLQCQFLHSFPKLFYKCSVITIQTLNAYIGTYSWLTQNYMKYPSQQYIMPYRLIYSPLKSWAGISFEYQVSKLQCLFYPMRHKILQIDINYVLKILFREVNVSYVGERITILILNYNADSNQTRLCFFCVQKCHCSIDMLHLWHRINF